jgi:hypothetical protein
MTGKRAAFQFTAQDVVPLGDRGQRWRFETEVQPHVRLLTPTTARAVHTDLVARYISTRAFSLAADKVHAIEEYDASGDDGLVASWLRSHETDMTLDVLVSHGSLGVYLVMWGLFCAHWGDFCLPSSDDVLICPVSETWILLYDHEDIFFWGRTRRR